jgi:uncharacterized metal-binding protein YceD (DUF177 family)
MKSVLVKLNTTLAVNELMSLPTDGGLEIEPDFSSDELGELAKRWGVSHLGPLGGGAVVKRWRDKGLSVRGKVTADVTQQCVVTLQPLTQRVEADLDVMMFPGADPLDMESDIEPLPTDSLQIGEMIAEHLALLVDPYPRAKNVDFEPVADNEPSPSPFAALAVLKSENKP